MSVIGSQFQYTYNAFDARVVCSESTPFKADSCESGY